MPLFWFSAVLLFHHEFKHSAILLLNFFSIDHQDFKRTFLHRQVLIFGGVWNTLATDTDICKKIFPCECLFDSIVLEVTYIMGVGFTKLRTNI